MGDFLKKIEDIKAQKVKNDCYFLIYFYAILVINIVADVSLVFLIKNYLGDGKYEANADKWYWKIDGFYLV